MPEIDSSVTTVKYVSIITYVPLCHSSLFPIYFIKINININNPEVIMPFKSVKQRKFLQINQPEIYKEWVKKYGKKIKKGK